MTSTTRRQFFFNLFLATVGASLLLSPAIARNEKPPPPAREFRAAWVATVHNLNWPSRPGLSAQQQKNELVALLDKARQLRLNAIILQVRPSCDALYKSSIEPWSPFLTGSMGRAPSPAYDPLEFAVAQAHARGLELHAWFNPFRAIASTKYTPSRSHVSRTNPSALRSAPSGKWLDPGLAFSRERTLSVIRDVVRRYDIDGVHIDDYFYPYPTNPKRDGAYPFPDASTYKAYRAQGGKLDLGDWRRRNIDTFVESLYRMVKSEKPWVKLGISPFGIYRPGHPRGIEADLDSYHHIYADSRKWLREGWCDYFSPQLYWRIDDRPHSFTALLGWWKSESKRGRHVWPGIASDRIASSTDPGRPPQETLRQIGAARSGRSSAGHIHWSIKPLLQNRKGLANMLAADAYREPALVPASPWLSRKAPQAPPASIAGGAIQFPAAGNTIAWWTVQTRTGGKWTTNAILHRTQKTIPVPGNPEAIAVTAIDRYGNASTPTILTVSR